MLTATTPHVKQFIAKQHIKHTHPYPPSGGSDGVPPWDSRTSWDVSSPQLVTIPVVDSKGTLRLGMAISHVLFCFWEWCCGNFYLLRKQIFMKVHYCNSRRVKSSRSSVTMMTIFICCESVYLLHRGGYNTPRRGLSPDVVRLADHQWYVTMIRHHKFHRMTRRCVWR